LNDFVEIVVFGGFVWNCFSALGAFVSYDPSFFAFLMSFYWFHEMVAG